MEVFNQRLEQEYGAEVIVTVPSVPYKRNYAKEKTSLKIINEIYFWQSVRIHGEKNIKIYGGKDIIVNNPAQFPEANIIEQ